MKGNIIYIGDFCLPDKNASAHRVLNNAKAMRASGYNVIFLGADQDNDGNVSVAESFKKIQGFDTWSVALPKTNSQWLKHLSDINPFYEVYKKYSDIKAIICYNYPALLFYKLKKFCHKNNIKLIADCTEWYGFRGSNFAKKIILSVDSFFRMRVFQKQTDGMIVISKYLANYYSKHKNLIIVPPLVDLEEDKWQGLNNKSDDLDKIKLVYAGSPGAKKDKLNIIISALFKLKDQFDFVFNIIGISADDYLSINPLHRYMVDDLSDKVFFLGRLPHLSSLQYVKEAHYSIIIREDNIVSKAGFPTKFVESISCSTPIISNNTSDLSEYIINGANGYIVDLELYQDLYEIFKNHKNNYPQMKVDNIVFDYKNYVDVFKNFVDFINELKL